MIRLPLTRTRGFGVFSVIGTSREPNPAAIKTARFTRYGSSASRPAAVIPPRSAYPAAASSRVTRFTVPRE